jgi:hypothetical protein
MWPPWAGGRRGTDSPARADSPSGRRSPIASLHPPQRQQRQVVAARRAGEERFHVLLAGGEHFGERSVLDASQHGGGAAEIWLLTLYAKARKENVPARILRQLKEALENE